MICCYQVSVVRYLDQIAGKILVHAPKRCITDFCQNLLHHILYVNILYFMKNSTKFGAKLKTFYKNISERVEKIKNKISLYYLPVHAF